MSLSKEFSGGASACFPKLSRDFLELSRQCPGTLGTFWGGGMAFWDFLDVPRLSGVWGRGTFPGLRGLARDLPGLSKDSPGGSPMDFPRGTFRNFPGLCWAFQGTFKGLLGTSWDFPGTFQDFLSHSKDFLEGFGYFSRLSKDIWDSQGGGQAFWDCLDCPGLSGVFGGGLYRGFGDFQGLSRRTLRNFPGNSGIWCHVLALSRHFPWTFQGLARGGGGLSSTFRAFFEQIQRNFPRTFQGPFWALSMASGTRNGLLCDLAGLSR